MAAIVVRRCDQKYGSKRREKFPRERTALEILKPEPKCSASFAFRISCMEGACCLLLVPWCMVHGACWMLVHGARCSVPSQIARNH